MSPADPKNTAVRNRRLCWGGGVLGTALFAVALPLGEDDPLRSTFVLLPLIWAALAEMWAAARRRGARRLPRVVAVGEALAVAAIVVAGLARPHLGLHDRVASFLYAGLVLLAAHHLLHLLPRWRPLLGSRLPRRPSGLFFLLPLLFYLALLPWTTDHRPPDGDEPYYLLITHSLAHDLDADLTDQYADDDWQYFLDRPLEPQPGDPVGPHGEQYSRHNALLPLVLVPAYRLLGLPGALAMMALMAAALAWTTLRLARHYVPERPGEALAAYGLLAFASPLVLYSSQVWVEVPATLLVVLTLDHILEVSTLVRNRERADNDWGWREWLGVGVPMLLLPLVKIRFMTVSVPLLALAWWRTGRPRRPLVVLALLLGVVAAGILWFNQKTYDNPLKIHSWEELDVVHQYPLADYVHGATGLFWDPAMGLFGTFPVWVVLLPAACLLVRRRQRWGGLLVDGAVTFVPYLLLVASRREWFGGWSPPFRYALIALPFLAVALVPLLARRHRGGARALLTALGLATLVLTTLWLTVPGWTYNFADGSSYLLDHLDRRFQADVTRLFPSGIRVRPATYVWPVVTALLVPLLWWWPRRWRQARSWGVAGLLTALALVPVAARNVPTRVVQIEDEYVTRDGGNPYPKPWTSDRPRYRGGWVVRKGESLTAPVVPGGSRVTFHIDVFHLRNLPGELLFRVQAGDEVLGVLDPETWPQGWHRVTLGPFPWPEGEPPLRIQGRWDLGPMNGVIFDKVELEWSP